MNSSMRRAVAALLITVSVISCGDAADRSTPVLTTASTGTAVSTSSTLSTTATAPGGPSTTAAATTTAVQLRVDVVARVPHDRGSFTEGLVMSGGKLYEGSGLRGASTLREVDRRSGTVTRSIAIAAKYFGEGIAIVDDRVIQLTWQEHTALVYQLTDFKQIATFTYDTEGWGLCDDGSRLVMSDGTNQLYFRNRTTFAVEGRVSVTKNGVPIDQLNELECVDGQVYANVWRTDTIVRIDPTSGRVTAEIDASGLLTAAEAKGVDVLNGIAYDASSKTFLLTGKYWPTMFEVRFVAV